MTRKKAANPIPEFRNETEEREFWQAQNRDSTDYVDWSQAKAALFPNLKASATSISLRLPDSMLLRIKAEANRLDVPYQSLMKIWLAEKLKESA